MAELITGLAYSVDLNDPVVRVKESGVFVRGDSYQQIAFTIMRGTEAVELSNVQAIVWFVNSNGISPFVVGTIADNVITVNVIPECTANVGRLYIQLQLGDTGHHTQTPIIIETHIVANATDAVVDTGNVLPSIAELLSQVEACETATTAATNAAEALDGITAEATTLAVGQSATAEMETDPLDGHYNVVIGIPQAQRGTKSYSGTAITGTSATPTVYATGITDAIIGDRYSYNGTDPAGIGNEYVCTLGGNAATALWTYDRNVRGEAGSGNVSTVDSVLPNGAGDVALSALRYVAMILTSEQKTQARSNIDAMPYGAISSNLIINGGFGINPRAVTGTVTLASGAYGHGCWKAGASGCTYTFATSGNVTTITISAGSLVQVIEGLNLKSGTVCISWNGTSQGKIGAGSFGASEITGTAVGGANLNIEFNTGTISNVQLNYGSVALPYVPRSYADDLRLCQRYALAFTTLCRVRAIMYATNTIDFFIPTPVPMRTLPSIATNAMSVIGYSSGAAITGFTFSVTGSSDAGFIIRADKGAAHGLADATLQVQLSTIGSITVFSSEL